MSKQLNSSNSSFLTAGMLKELIRGKNIPQLERLVDGVDDSHVMFLHDYNGKGNRWSKEEIKFYLSEINRPITEWNVENVRFLLSCPGKTVLTPQLHRDPFPVLYYLKRLYLYYAAKYASIDIQDVFECINHNTVGNPETKDKGERLRVLTSCYTDMFNTLCYKFQNNFPKVVLDDVLYGDISDFLKEEYGTESLREIEEPKVLEEMINDVLDCIPTACNIWDDAEAARKCKYELLLWDFHARSVNFEKEKDVNDFVNAFEVEPATLFERQDDGNWTEVWSI